MYANPSVVLIRIEDEQSKKIIMAAHKAFVVILG